MHTLVTLLGAPRFKEDGSYEETTYLFEDGSESKTAYVGLALKEKIKPDQIVVLGTTGSNWHSFVKYCLQQMQQDWKSNQELLTNLEIGYRKDEVQLIDLDKASKLLSDSEKNRYQYKLLLVPYGKNKKEQTETLHIMMQNFAWQDEATIDVTYGLRHLPMLMQQSALLLQSIKDVKIHNIFYGAFDLAKNNAGKTPMMVLDGLLEIDIWTKAFHRYEQDGDYTAFQEPLKHEKIPSAAITALKEAAYYERTFNLTAAGKKLETVKTHLPNEFDGIGSFFTERFKHHITWSSTSSLKKRQAELAHFYLKNGDFVRASIFAVESFITSLLKPQELRTQQNYKTRNNALKQFRESSNNHVKSDRGNIEKFSDFEQLSRIRNALAHGTEPSPNIADLMQNQESLAKCLYELFDRLDINPNT